MDKGGISSLRGSEGARKIGRWEEEMKRCPEVIGERQERREE